MKYIEIRGVTCEEKVADCFANYLVDQAYILEISDGVLKVGVDEGIDLFNREDYDWIKDILYNTLKDCGEEGLSLKGRGPSS